MPLKISRSHENQRPLDALFLDWYARPSHHSLSTTTGHTVQLLDGYDAGNLCEALRPLRAVSLDLSNCHIDDTFCCVLLRSLQAFAAQGDGGRAAQWADLDLDFRWSDCLTDAGVAFLAEAVGNPVLLPRLSTLRLNFSWCRPAQLYGPIRDNGLATQHPRGAVGTWLQLIRAVKHG